MPFLQLQYTQARACIRFRAESTIRILLDQNVVGQIFVLGGGELIKTLV